MYEWILHVWKNTGFLDYLGVLSLLLLVVYLLKIVYVLLKQTPQWQENGDIMFADFWGVLIALILSTTAITWRDALDANIYGIGALNAAVGIVIRALLPIFWVWSTWLHWSRGPNEDATQPMQTIVENRVIPALGQGIISATIVSSTLAGSEVEPAWLNAWWVIFLATTFFCASVTKLGSTFQPIEIWHQITKQRYRSQRIGTNPLVYRHLGRRVGSTRRLNRRSRK